MKKVIVTYSTWAGSTRGIAEEIAKVIGEHGFQVDVINAKDEINFTDYDAFILGTSIHAGSTVRSFRKLLRKNELELSKKPTAFYVNCANLIEDTEKNREETMNWLKKATSKYQTIKPIAVGLFGGATLTNGEDFTKLNFFIRKTISAMNRSMLEEYGKSDFRDFEKIHSWAENLASIISKS